MQRRTLLQLFAASAVDIHRRAQTQTQPAYFPKHEFETLSALCEMIVPAEAHVGGAIEAGVPAFIDLLASENLDYQRRLSGGLLWLDAACASRFQVSFLACTPQQRHVMLDQIAFRANVETDPSLLAGNQFFTFVRDLTLDGFFTSRIGIDYLEFRGNQPLTSFPGCPAE